MRIAELKINDGWLQNVTRVESPHFDQRPDNCEINLLVVHNISLPPGEFGGGYVQPFFQGKLPTSVHPFFEEIARLRVSAHCLIERDGTITQFVSFNDRAWHAGFSTFQGTSRCNDFSIGIELEGTDSHIYTDLQYQSLMDLTKSLMQQYPKMTLGRIVGHNDIAPGRKTDPGESFDWCRFRTGIS